MGLKQAFEEKDVPATTGASVPQSSVKTCSVKSQYHSIYFFFLEKQSGGIMSGSSLLSLSYTVISPPLPTGTKVHPAVKTFQSCFATDREAPLPTHPPSVLHNPAH